MPIMDDYLQEIVLKLLWSKSKAFRHYVQHEAFLKGHCGVTQVGTLCMDCGGEYTSDKFETHLKNNGTIHEKTVHDLSAQNGKAECFLRTIVERGCALLIASGLPKSLWGAAMSHTVWLWNWTGLRSLAGTTLYEKVHGTKPDLSNLHKWGCRVWVKIEGRSRLDVQADKGRFVGHSAESKGILVYWPMKWRISVKRNVCWDDSPLLEVAIDEINNPNANI